MKLSATKKWTLFRLALIAAFLFAGCKTEEFLAQFEGSYKGFLKESGANEEKTSPIMVNVQVSGKDGLLIYLNSSGSIKNEKLDVKVKGISSFRISSQSKRILEDEVILKKDSESCFAGDIIKEDKTSRHIEMCLKKDEFSLDIVRSIPDSQNQGISILVNRTDQPGQMEQPQEYKMSDLFQMSLTKNFDSRIQFETYKGARAQARVVYGNMFSHIGANTILSVMAGPAGVLGWASLVGDLAPFLLPNRWFQAKETADMRDAQMVGVSIMRANSGNLVEGLGLLLVRDEEILAALKRNLTEVAVIRDDVSFREQVGTMPKGSGDQLLVVTNGMEQNIIALETAIEEEYENIANGVGFLNPKAIKKLINDNNDSVKKPFPINGDEFVKTMLEKSQKLLELAQIDKLLAAAKVDKYARIFNWMDAQGDNSGNIGLGLVGYIQVAKSNIRLIGIQKEKLKSSLLQKASTALSENNLNIKLFAKVSEDFDNYSRIVSLYLHNIKTGIALNLPDLALALQNKAQQEVQMITVDYNYRINLDKIRRLILTDGYEGLPKP